MSEYLRDVSDFSQARETRDSQPGIDFFDTHILKEIVEARQQLQAQEVASRVHFFDPQRFEGPRYFEDISAISDYMVSYSQSALVFTSPAEFAFNPRNRQRTIVRYSEQIDDYVPNGQLLTEESKPFSGDTVAHCRGLVVLCDSTQRIGIELHSSDTILFYNQGSSSHLDDELSSERLKYGLLSEKLRNNTTNSLFVTKRVARHLIDQVVSQEEASSRPVPEYVGDAT